MDYDLNILIENGIEKIENGFAWHEFTRGKCIPNSYKLKITTDYVQSVLSMAMKERERKDKSCLMDY